MKKLVINKSDLISNINKIKEHTSVPIIATLKNNGYGLGLNEYPKILLEAGIDFFAVSTIEEAITLRKNGFTNRIMLLHSTALKKDIETLIENNIILTIGSFASLNNLLEVSTKKTDVQIKLDTGFGRFGFSENELPILSSKLKDNVNLNIIGTFSHFSMSFSKNENYTIKQFDLFKKHIESLKAFGINPGITHICNSSAYLKYKNMHLDAVRVGSALLGRILVPNNINLTKIGKLSSVVEDTNMLSNKHYIGYSNTFKTKKETKTGIIPIGYLDGFGLKKSNDCFRLKDIFRYIFNDLKEFNKKYFVTINNKQIPVLGKIGTNNIVVELSNDMDVGDSVYLEINPMLVNPLIPREFIP